MKYIVGIVLVVVAGLAAFYYLNGTNATNYTADVASDVEEIEREFAELDAKVAAGTLSPEEASAARTRIVARLEAIDAQVAASGNARLTDAQKQQLTAALLSLKQTLVKYRATLVTVETEAKKHRGGGGGRSITEVLDDIVESLEDHVEEVVEEYESSDDEEMEDEMNDEEDEMNDDEESEEESEDDDETSTSTDDGTETETETEVEVETETELEVQ